MNQQPDKFFRDKLQGFSKPAPSDAWHRIEANLDKKNNKPFWLEIAATIALLLTTGLLLLKSDLNNTKLAQQETNTPITDARSDSASTMHKHPEERKSASKTDEREKTPAAKRMAKKQPKATDNIAAISDQKREPNQVTTDLTEKKHDSVSSPGDNAHIDAQHFLAETVFDKSKKQSKHMTLVLSADEVNEKYLDKKSLAQATSQEKKTSTLKKVLDKANDLKHNQDVFGEIRQKKNEILALNFKSEKERSQNQ